MFFELCKCSSWRLDRKYITWPGESHGPYYIGICTIDRGEILLNETDNGAMDIDHAGNNLDNSESGIPVTEALKCLLNVDLLQAAFDVTPLRGLKAIVILKEYEFLRELLERELNDCDFKDFKDSFYLVIGHPGTGLSNHTGLRFCIFLTSCRQNRIYPLSTPLPPREETSDSRAIFSNWLHIFRRSRGVIAVNNFTCFRKTSTWLLVPLWWKCVCGTPLPAFYAR